MSTLGRVCRTNRSRTQIKSGELKPGDKLPSTRDLAEAYQVHMNTASRALSLLHDRELITGQPGRGTYVAERPGR
nr:GntR family transcriptional regulator [Micromonospora yangpuensis]